MGLIDRIKQFWINRKQKALPEVQTNLNYIELDNSSIFKNLFKSQKNTSYSKVDYDIERFLDSYCIDIQNLSEMNQPIDNYRRAYTSLVGLNGNQVTQEEYNYNAIKENELLNELYQNNQYTVQPEKGFYHIQSPGYQMPDSENMIRVYINCENANIAELSQTILSNNKNPNFYMKFPSNDSNAEYPRSEKVVIYCENNDYDYTMQLLEYCKQTKPDVFKGSEKTLPFFETRNGMASVSREPLSNQYTNLYGQNKTIVQSVNSFITNILEESYMESAREIARSDSNLEFLVNNENYYDETLYMKNWPYIKENYKDYLIQSMKAKMEVLSKQNNIYIDGLNYTKDQNEQQRENDLGGKYGSR